MWITFTPPPVLLPGCGPAHQQDQRCEDQNWKGSGIAPSSDTIL